MRLSLITTTFLCGLLLIALETTTHAHESTAPLTIGAAPSDQAAPGTFQVLESQFGTLMIDSRSGGTWLLAQNASGAYEWQMIAIPGQAPTGNDAAKPYAPPARYELGFRLKDHERGLEVTLVQPGSLAALSGVQVGDILTVVDGSAKPDLATMHKIVAAKKDNQGIELVIERSQKDKNGTPFVRSITLTLTPVSAK